MRMNAENTCGKQNSEMNFVTLGKHSYKLMPSENVITELLRSVPAGVKVVAVSKTKPPEEILKVYNSGHRIFGENRVQELISKSQVLPGDIEWHLVGHLQTNKVRYIAGFISMIHSVDSLKLLLSVNAEAQKAGRVIDVLLQVYIADEETKFGLERSELISILSSPEIKTLNNTRIRGLMGIASFTDDKEKIRSEFKSLHSLFEECKSSFFQGISSFSEISMGMSGDFRIAVEEGATILRIGSLIFGERNYQ
jgi:PLP dependent protein